VDRQLVTDVSAQPISHMFKDQALQEEILNTICKIFISFNIKYYLGKQSTVIIKIFRRTHIHYEDNYRDLVRKMMLYIYIYIYIYRVFQEE